MKNEFDVSGFDQEILRRAKAGNAKDARTALVSAVIALGRVSHTSPYLDYLRCCVERILAGAEPNEVLNIAELKVPGRPARATNQELMAVDLYLRNHLELPPEKSIDKVLELFNLSDRRKIQRLRKQYDGVYSDADSKLMEQLSVDHLLAELSGSMRSKVAAIKPHTN